MKKSMGFHPFGIKILMLIFFAFLTAGTLLGCKKKSVAKTYTLNVTATNGTVLKNPNQATYNEGDIVQLTATPNSGYVFTSWSGDATGPTNPLPVTMNANKNITANFPVFSDTVVNVTSFGATGNDETDDTQAIQDAIDWLVANHPGGTVLVPDGTYWVTAKSSPWQCPAIELKSNMTFKMTSGATIRLKPNNKGSYAILFILNATNVNVVGGKIQGDRHQHLTPGDDAFTTPYSPECPDSSNCWGQWGMGISISAGSNVNIDSVIFTECWGDGLYVAGEPGTSTNININSVTSDDNRRQGMSIENVDGMNVRNSTFKNTGGHMPQAGIDIEPYADGQVATNVMITNCQFLNNRGQGLQIWGTNRTNNVTFTANTLSNNIEGIYIKNTNSNTITNNTIVDPSVGIDIAGGVSGCTITGNNITAPTCISGSALGNTVNNNPCIF